uniref:Uncharacterized protein n=1 Tax=Oryza sativa subsp. japonica TaxID=39947 RepID=Q6Z9E9_ORYSJ|nr:hypothetical protein [Oryza sativa Japonica Group]
MARWRKEAASVGSEERVGSTGRREKTPGWLDLGMAELKLEAWVQWREMGAWMLMKKGDRNDWLEKEARGIVLRLADHGGWA